MNGKGFNHGKVSRSGSSLGICMNYEVCFGLALRAAPRLRRAVL